VVTAIVPVGPAPVYPAWLAEGARVSRSSEEVWRLVLDGSGWPALWCAAALGDRDAVGRELAAGADPNAAGDQGTTPLQVAAQNGHQEVAELLLDAEADANRADPHGNGPLWNAVHQACLARRTDGNLTIVTMLLAGGADPDHKNRYGRSPRDRASLGDEVVAALFRHGDQNG
jgi:ankyrin repeat protein